MPSKKLGADNRLKEQFLCCLPDIQRYAGHVFRRCLPDDRDDLIAETVARMWLSFIRLSGRGKDPRRVFRPLLRFCVLAIKDDRRVGGRRNVLELCHRARRDGVRICSLEEKQHRSGSPWKEILAETRAFSPAATAAARLDIDAWLQSQSTRNRSVANLLAVGERTSVVAARFRVSSARISQLRRELQESWERFQGIAMEPPKSLAVTA
jgi:DNA-directed RNA polymerase specialized sigma24 family protein